MGWCCHNVPCRSLKYLYFVPCRSTLVKTSGSRRSIFCAARARGTKGEDPHPRNWKHRCNTWPYLKMSRLFQTIVERAWDSISRYPSPATLARIGHHFPKHPFGALHVHFRSMYPPVVYFPCFISWTPGVEYLPTQTFCIILEFQSLKIHQNTFASSLMVLILPTVGSFV